MALSTFVRGIVSNMENSHLWKDVSFESRRHLYESKERTMGNRVSVAVMKSILGRLKAMSTSTLVVVSERGGTYSVAICPETVFMRSGPKSQFNHPKVGDRVLVNILEIGDDLHAVEVHSGEFATSS
jgi:hypothetical protein